MIELNEENFDEEVLNEKRPVVLYFASSKNMDCKNMQNIVKNLEQELSQEVKFVTVDVDKQFKIALKYQIFDVPSYVVMLYGMHQKRLYGVCSKEELLKFIK